VICVCLCVCLSVCVCDSSARCCTSSLKISVCGTWHNAMTETTTSQSSSQTYFLPTGPISAN